MATTIADDARRLREEHGGFWGEHHSWPVDDWTTEVSNGETRLGYWEWVAAQVDSAGASG